MKRGTTLSSTVARLMGAGLAGGLGLASAAPTPAAPADGAKTNGAATTASQPASAPKDTLEFLNGDLLRGGFLSYDTTAGLRWQHSSIKHVLTIDPVGVYKVRLQNPAATKAERPNCMVRLGNGDEIFGNLVSLDEKAMKIDTWYAGVIEVPRESLQTVAVGLSRFKVLYEGPNGTEGWTLKGTGNVNLGGQVFVGGFNGRVVLPGANPAAANGWQYKDGAFYGVGNGSLGREVNLPESSNIEFDLAWRGYPQISVFFYTDRLEGYGGNAYVMQFSYRNIYLRRNSQTGRTSNLGTVEMPNLVSRSKAHFSIRTDRENKTVALFMDEMLVKQWTDNANFTEGGTGLLFYLQGQQPVKLSNLRITEWDGRLDSTEGPAANPKEDLAKLVNKDKVSGTVKTIKDGKLVFGTTFAPLEIPLERVVEIDFAADGIKNKAVGGNDVRLYFADRGQLTMQVERWNDLQVVGVSPNFGKAKFIPNAFSSIQFNLNEQKLDVDSPVTMPNAPFQPDLWIED